MCGRRCVWCAASLNTATAVDLGERTIDAHGSGARWFPRCCRDCGYRRLFAAFKKHANGCKQCSTSLPWCLQGQTLFRAALDFNRQSRR